MHHADYPEVTITLAVHGGQTMPTRAVVATLKAAGITAEEFNREA